MPRKHILHRLLTQKVKARLEIYFLILQIFWISILIFELIQA